MIWGLILIDPLWLNTLYFDFLFEIAPFEFFKLKNMSCNSLEDSSLHKPNLGNETVKSSECLNKIAKIYNSIFDPNLKGINIINPYPLIKEAYLKTSGFNSENIHPNTTLATSSADNISSKVPKLNSTAYNLPGENNSGSSPSSEDSSYNTTVIDIKVLLGTDDQMKQSLVLKDKNDPSCQNLIGGLKNPENAKLGYERSHVQVKNCYNYKFIKFDLKKPIVQGTNSIQNISFNINTEAINKINRFDLIIESENFNRLPIKNNASFTSGNPNFFTGD